MTVPTFVEYVEAGLFLCPIRDGEKRPRGAQWNAIDKDGVPVNALTAEAAERVTSAGLMHVDTMALDVDNLDGARAYLMEHGVDLDALLKDEDRVGISSGRPGSAKLLFSVAHLPRDVRRRLRGKKIVEAGVTLFELRHKSTQGKPEQDLLPPSLHPSGTRYEWACGLTGDWRNLPPIPAALLDLWLELIGGQQSAAPVTSNQPALLSDSAEPNAPLLADARRILDATDPDCDYDTWIKLGMALEHELGADGWAMWNDWSAKGRKYPGTGQLESHWNSFGRSPTPVTLGTFKRQLAASRDDFEDLTNVDLDDDPFEAMAREKARVLRISVMPERAALPEVQWIIAPLIARGFVTSFTGHGGTGKSTESLTQAAHVACGVQYRNFPTHAGRALIVSLEDPEHVVWLRLYRIAETFDLDMELIRQNVTVVAVDVHALLASGQDTVLATEQRVAGIATLQFTSVFDEVRDLARGHDFIVIDNSSDAYGADENSRPLVRAFVRGLQHHMAVPNNAGILLLGHVDKAAARKSAVGNSYSGSTAWHNSVRSRLVLTQAEDGSDVVLFTQEKNNLAKRWAGVNHYAPNEAGILVEITPEVAQQRAADALAPVMEHVLAAIRSAETDDVPVYTATGGSHTAHSVLSKRPGFPADITAKQTNAAITKLRDRKQIKAVDFQTASRHTSTKWVTAAATPVQEQEESGHE